MFSIFNLIINDLFTKYNRFVFYENSKKFWETSGIEKLNFSSVDLKKFWEYVEVLSNGLKELNSYKMFLNKLKEICISKDINTKYKRAIIFSQLHMTANRLGVPISYELFFYSIGFDREKLNG